MSEKLPDSITAYVEVNSNKHVWGQWAQLNNKTKQSGKITRRHDYYTISNWSFLANPELSRREAFAQSEKICLNLYRRSLYLDLPRFLEAVEINFQIHLTRQFPAI